MTKAILIVVIAMIAMAMQVAAMALQLPDNHTSPKSLQTLVPAGFHSAYADVNDQRIHYVMGGSGEPLLLVHGWPETWYEWRKVMPILAKKYTVIAVDYRGAGDSSKPQTGYSKKVMADDLRELIKSLGIRSLNVVGHDWGGPVAYAFAAQGSPQVRKLVIVEGFPEGKWTHSDTPYWFFGFQRIPGYAEHVVKGKESAYLAWFYRNPTFIRVKGAIDDTAINEYLRNYGMFAGMKAGFELYRTFDEDVADNTAFAKTPLSMPVLAIGGAGSAGTLVAENMRHVATQVTGCLIPDTGHFIPEERPAELAAMIDEFVSSSHIQDCRAAVAD